MTIPTDALDNLLKPYEHEDRTPIQRQIERAVTNGRGYYGEYSYGEYSYGWFPIDVFGECPMKDPISNRTYTIKWDPRHIYDLDVGGRYVGVSKEQGAPTTPVQRATIFFDPSEYDRAVVGEYAEAIMNFRKRRGVDPGD